MQSRQAAVDRLKALVKLRLQFGGGKSTHLVGDGLPRRDSLCCNRYSLLSLNTACRAPIHAEGELTEMDRVTGDGDLGSSMERGAKAVQVAVASFLWTMFRPLGPERNNFMLSKVFHLCRESEQETRNL